MREDIPAALPVRGWRDERLQRAFDRSETDALSDGELAALVMKGGSSGGKDGAQDVAARLLAGHGGLDGIARASLRELSLTPGMGPAKAMALKAALELGRRAAAAGRSPGRRMTSSRDVAAWLGPRLAPRKRERFVVLLLNGRHELIRDHLVSIGSLTSSIVHPREAFLPAVRESAAAVIFAHNHPSGDPEPSDEDRRLTERLVEAGALLGIRVLDHVVVAARGFVSLMDGSRTA